MTQTKTISLTYLSFSKSFILIPNAIFQKTHICQNTFRIYILLKCIPVRVRVELPNATLISFLDIEKKKDKVMSTKGSTLFYNSLDLLRTSRECVIGAQHKAKELIVTWDPKV